MLEYVRPSPSGGLSQRKGDTDRSLLRREGASSDSKVPFFPLIGQADPYSKGPPFIKADYERGCEVLSTLGLASQGLAEVGGGSVGRSFRPQNIAIHPSTAHWATLT